MSSIYLEDYIENAEFYLERFIPALIDNNLDWKGVQEMTTAFRQRGVCSLLLYGEPSRFFVNMMQSGGAFLHFLQRCSDSVKITSHAKPFFDALGGGFWECATEIARNSRMKWNEGYEYEDDFLYVKFMMKYFFLAAEDNECQILVENFEKAQAGAEIQRLAVCKAFLTGDNKLFEETLPILLEERSDKVKAMIERDALPEEIRSWLQYFSSEGLALVRLGEKRWFTMDETYLHIPDPVRRDPLFSFDPDAWRNLTYAP